MAPINLIQLVSTSKIASVFTNIASKLTDNLGIGLHVNLLLYFYILPCGYYYLHVFFFEIRLIEEVQDPNRSPGREEVGRRTLGDYGGFLLPIFYRASFTLVNN